MNIKRSGKASPSPEKVFAFSGGKGLVPCRLLLELLNLGSLADTKTVDSTMIRFPQAVGKPYRLVFIHKLLIMCMLRLRFFRRR